MQGTPRTTGEYLVLFLNLIDDFRGYMNLSTENVGYVVRAKWSAFLFLGILICSRIQKSLILTVRSKNWLRRDVSKHEEVVVVIQDHCVKQKLIVLITYVEKI